ncbi:hypothetical protein [Spirosoma arcticum]
MSILHTVKEFFSGTTVLPVRADSPELLSAELELPTAPVNDWEITMGRVHGPQQERNVIYRNNEITGTCTGKIGELTGSVMVGLFEDLPTWLPSLFIRVTVQAGEGELTVSFRERNGAIVGGTAPGSFEGNAELTDGRVWLRCESGPKPVRNVRYEVAII